jgi:hypothetical protein
VQGKSISRKDLTVPKNFFNNMLEKTKKMLIDDFDDKME